MIAANATNVIYSILKDLNTSTSLEATSPAAVHILPEALKNAYVDQNLGQHGVRGVFFTHHRLALHKPIEAIRKRFGHAAPANVVDVEQCETRVGLQLPLEFSYTAVRLDASQVVGELTDRINKERAAMNPDEINEAEDRVATLTPQVRGSRTKEQWDALLAVLNQADQQVKTLKQQSAGNPGLRPSYEQAVADRDRLKRDMMGGQDERQWRTLNSELEKAKQLIRTYKSHERSANRVLQEMKSLKEAANLVYMKDFTVRIIEEIGPMKAKNPTGMKAKGAIAVRAKQFQAGGSGGSRTGVAIQFDWHQDGVGGLGWAKDWHGTLEFVCGADGRPDGITGTGKFAERFNQFGQVF
ncbi:hypothetical protein ADL00_16080 [Streptomyces sp. AS58]|uniref:hypothetical protein n=1 Tax=Streptomyces sp. AS58 TaxID=1519489 RepID=UPI0006AE2853|nr:hypothetical protein [Streptomyces sp. AS58]KOV67324.1 hypothetical protein ADL00_16080 [Streptomyces sp. AS58]